MSDAPPPEPLLRFKCPACGTGLGVDPALAGVEGPCPRCGVVLTAPEVARPRPPGPSVPTSGVTRSVRGGGLRGARQERPRGTMKKASPAGELSTAEPASSELASSERRRVSKNPQPKRISDGEKDALWQFGKVALAVVAGILIFLAVSYYLKNS